jgi:hypothetical protein
MKPTPRTRTDTRTADRERSSGCPHWCTAVHGVLQGEEDSVHHGETLLLDDDSTARLCMSIDPSTGEHDGPYILIGSKEYTLDQAAQLADQLAALTAVGRAYSPSSRNALSRS